MQLLSSEMQEEVQKLNLTNVTGKRDRERNGPARVRLLSEDSLVYKMIDQIS
jgi:hypothetical protein